MQRLWAVVCALVLCVAGVVGVQQPAAAAGVTWTAQTAPEGFWNSVTYGNGLFVAVGDDDTNQVMTSPDGVDWTAQTAPDADWVSVTYGNGLFVAVGDGTKPVMTSPDGVTWTAQTAPESNFWSSVTYGNGLFVAVADRGTKPVMTSPDGVTWTARTAPDADWFSVTYGDGLFVAVADARAGLTGVMTSPDGVTWTARTAPDAEWFSVTYGDGLFVAVGDGTKPVMTSPDGVTWTAQTAPDTDWYSVTYGNGLFVAVGDGTKQVMTSGKLDAQVTVNARKESKKLTSGKKYKVVRSASTNATLTKANARCYLNGKRLKGKSKRALCRTKVKNTGSNVVIKAKPLCSSGLSIRAKIVANDPNMAKASFKRTWAVKKRPSARGDILSDCQKLLP